MSSWLWHWLSDMDPRCIFDGYVSCRYGSAVYVLETICSSQIMSKWRTATLKNCKKILGCSLQVFLLVYFTCFLDRFTKYFTSRFARTSYFGGGNLLYHIFSLVLSPWQWARIKPCHLDTLLTCDTIAALWYLFDLCFSIGHVLSLWSSLKTFKN